MEEIESLFQKVEPELLKAFSFVPEYGALSFTVVLNEREPVRIEWGVSTSRKLLRKAERGNA